MERNDHYALSGYAIDERCPLVPDEIYAASKAAQSLACQAYARSYDLPIVVFRCSNLCGSAAPHGPRHGWVTWLCIQAALGWTIEIQGSGKQTRDILYASDVESAALLAFSALESGDVERGRIFNLGGGSANLLSVLQLVEMLRAMGAKFETRQGPGRKHEDMLFCTDSSAVQRDLGWERKVPVREAVARIYEWACANRDALAVVYEGERS
jgi:CDP-paratose 2-epimerase